MPAATLTRRGFMTARGSARSGSALRLHLLRRATYGPTPATVNEIERLGFTGWLDRQLAPETVSDGPGNAVRRLYPELGWSISEARAGTQQFSWELMFRLGQATIGQAAWSKRQLFEVMVEFWSNHLNVTCPSDNVWDNRHHYDRHVIRRHAFGKFADMLAASAKHPAMLRFLNQADSTKDAPNENYGRELLELHTVGVDAGYTEDMMVDSARIMTGYTVSDAGAYRYDPGIHWRGSVQVLGFRDANAAADGRDVAARYIDYLTHHPATARRLATKLAQRFVADDPPSTLVDRLAGIYLKHDTAIAPMLRALFTSDEFAAAPAKVRRPYEDAIATMRVLGVGLFSGNDDAARRRGLEALYWMIEGTGQAPLAWGLPDGYPDVADAWQSAGDALQMWNLHQQLAAGWWPSKAMFDVADCRSFLPTPLPATYGDLVDALSHRLLFRRLPSAHREAVFTFCGVSATTALRPDSDWVGWRLSHLVALILDAPAHRVR